MRPIHFAHPETLAYRLASAGVAWYGVSWGWYGVSQHEVSWHVQLVQGGPD